jgi:hypothetical protein
MKKSVLMFLPICVLCISIILVTGCTGSGEDENSYIEGKWHPVQEYNYSVLLNNVKIVRPQNNRNYENPETLVLFTLNFKNIQDPNTTQSTTVRPIEGLIAKLSFGEGMDIHCSCGDNPVVEIRPGQESSTEYFCTYNEEFKSRMCKMQGHPQITYHYENENSSIGPWGITGHYLSGGASICYP